MNLFNEVDFLLKDVDTLLEGYIEISPYDSIFFEGGKADKEAAQAEQNNAEIEGESLGIFRKISLKIRDIFKRIVDMIKGVIDRFTIGGKAENDEERAGFKEFQQMIKDNPEFAGKKVDIHDYRAIQKEYEATLSEAEKKYKTMKETAEGERPSFVKDCEAKLKQTKAKAGQIAKSTASAMTVQAAIDYAKTSKEAAAQIQAMINYDQGLLSALESQIGSKQMKKAKRQIKMLRSRFFVIRWIAGWRHEQAVTVTESIKNTMTSVRSIAGAFRKGTGKGSKLEAEGKAVKQTVKYVAVGGVKDGAKQALHNSAEAGSRLRRTERYNRKHGLSNIRNYAPDDRDTAVNDHIKDLKNKEIEKSAEKVNSNAKTQRMVDKANAEQNEKKQQRLINRINRRVTKQSARKARKIAKRYDGLIDEE